MENEILDFIKIFQSSDNIQLFSECACYWFAYILESRFSGDIMYNPDSVHFATRIGSKLFDINGMIDEEEYRYYEIYSDYYVSCSPQELISIESCIKLK